MNKRTLLLLAVLLFASWSGARPIDAADETKDLGELTLTTKRVVVFKDGYSLFVREGTATADAKGRVHTYEVPDAAVLGSFWAFSKDKKLIGMQAQLVDRISNRTEAGPCLDMLDLLRANQNRRVTLGLADDKEVAGLLVKVLERPKPKPVVAPGTAPHVGAETEVRPDGSQFVMLRDTARGQVILPVSSVRTMSGDELITDIERTFSKIDVRKRIQLGLGTEQAGKPTSVMLMYFAPGLRWIPTYRLSGDLEKSTDLALQAEILNEAMDLTDVAADLVVGVPHFKFGTVISPLALEAQLQNALQRAAPQLMGQMGSNALSNAYFSNRAGEQRDSTGGRLDIAPELATEGNQDLFLYSIPRLTLPKRARATLPLWQSTVPLAHLYTLDVRLGRDALGGRTYVRQKQRGRPQPVDSPLDLAQHSVWHQLELTNDGDVPWTTGAALTMKGLVPLGQDMLTYTSIGTKSLLPLTIAVDVCAGYEEREIGREPNAMRVDGHTYSLIKKRATINVCNYRSEPTKLRIQMATGGKVFGTSDEGVVKINDFRSDDWTNRGRYEARFNHHSDVEWTLTLEPGEQRDITADYEFFMR